MEISKATGIPVIRDEMVINGNLESVFYTNEENILFLVTLLCHKDWLVTKSTEKVTKSAKKVTKSLTKLIELVDFLKDEKYRHEILSFLGLDNQTKNFSTPIKPLIDHGIIEMGIPDKPNSRLQKYRLTAKGKKLLKSE